MTETNLVFVSKLQDGIWGNCKLMKRMEPEVGVSHPLSAVDALGTVPAANW